MDHAPLMAVGDRAADLSKKCHAVADREAVRIRITRDREGLLDVFHDEIRHRAARQLLHPHGVDAGDSRMGEPPEDLGLVVESFRSGGGEKSGADHLDGDGPTGHPLQSFIDPPHAPLGDAPHDRHIAEPRAGHEVAHRRSSRRRSQQIGQPRGTEPAVANRIDSHSGCIWFGSLHGESSVEVGRSLVSQSILAEAAGGTASADVPEPQLRPRRTQATRWPLVRE